MNKTKFQNHVWDYYKKDKRIFPWRETSDPYHILVSELMLQQTQTSRVAQKYPVFIEQFPTVQSLAGASFKAVLKHWMGLGYNRRAKYLHESAKAIVSQFNGTIPSDPEILQTLPGIGEYTSAAISTFACNLPNVFLETNIRSVFLHHFFSKQDNVPDSEILPLVEASLSRENPRNWYYALMDYGAYIKENYPNPNRRSKHYAKQSVFEGSNRQVRARILRELLNKSQSKQSLKTKINDERFERILSNLVEEEIVDERKGVCAIK